MANSTAPLQLLRAAKHLHVLKSLSHVWETFTSVLRNELRPVLMVCLNTGS